MTVWIGASHVLGRPVPTEEPCPHICGATVTGQMTGRPVVLRRGVWRGYADCAACAQEHPARTTPPIRREAI